MSFLGDLFGSSSTPTQPAPVQSAPKISDASVEATNREQAARLKNRRGVDASILTSGLGDTSAGPNNVNRVTALGGNSSIAS